MGYDLTNHFPFGPADGIQDHGFTLKAWQPKNDDAKREAVVQAFSADGELVREVVVPMSYPNIFGVDVADHAAIEEAADKMMKELAP